MRLRKQLWKGKKNHNAVGYLSYSSGILKFYFWPHPLKREVGWSHHLQEEGWD